VLSAGARALAVVIEQAEQFGQRTMQSKRQLVLNLQSGSRATPCPVQGSEFALMASAIVHALANL